MPQNDMVMINTNIEISGPTLQKIVETAKKVKGPDSKGYFHLDTADIVSRLISRFIGEQGFYAYAADRRNYEACLSGEEG